MLYWERNNQLCANHEQPWHQLEMLVGLGTQRFQRKTDHKLPRQASLVTREQVFALHSGKS